MLERLLFIGKLASNRKACTFLQEQGYDLTRTEGLRPSLRALLDNAVQVVIIDTNDATVINVRRLTRAARRQVNRPFIILLVNHHNGIEGDIPHDTYLVRPFTPRRLEKLVRKQLDGRRDYVVHLGPITLDRRTHFVQTSSGVTRLTPKQFQLLDFFLDHPGQVLTRRQLMQRVWETDYLGDTRTLDVHIRWLRERIEEAPNDPVLIRTVRGHGYCLAVDGDLQVGGDPIEAVQG